VRSFRSDRERHLHQLSSVGPFRSSEPPGVLIDADGETVTLVRSGRIVGPNRLMALLTLLVARSHPAPAIALPLTVPPSSNRSRRERSNDRADRSGPALAE